MLSISPTDAAACQPAQPLPIGQMAAVELDRSVTEKIFFLNISTAGILSIEVTMDEWAEGDPELMLLDALCQPIRVDPRVLPIERLATQQAFAVAKPAAFYVRLAANDAPFAPTRFQLEAQLLPADIVRAEHWLSSPIESTSTVIEHTAFYPRIAQKNEPEEVDPDPNKSTFSEPLLTQLTARHSSPFKNEPEEVDPDPNKRLRRPTPTTHLALFPARPAIVRQKSEPEEVDPDPNKALRSQALEGLLVVDSMTASTPPARSWVRLQVAIDRSSSTSSDALVQWLAAVHEAEIARSRLLTPGAGRSGLQLVEIEIDRY